MFSTYKFCSSLVKASKLQPINLSSKLRWSTHSPSNTLGTTNIYKIHPQLQSTINKQINTELRAFYAYMALGNYYENFMYGLKGFVKLQKEQMQEELEHASVLMQLMHLRHGRVNLQAIEPPQPQHWSSPLEAVKTTLQIETVTATGLKDVIAVAEELSDQHIAHTVRDKLYSQQMKCLHDTTQLLEKLQHCTSPECLLIIDQYFQNDS